jgi:hypothetical protein
MLPKHHKTFGLLGDCFSHKATVFVEAVNVSLITCVEKNWAGGGVPVGRIHKVADVEFRTVTACVEVVNFSLE